MMMTQNEPFQSGRTPSTSALLGTCPIARQCIAPRRQKQRPWHVSYRHSWPLVIVVFMLVCAGCGSAPESSPAQTTIPSNTVVLTFSGTPVTAGQIDSTEVARVQALEAQGQYDNASGAQRNIELYAFTRIFDSIELAKLLRQYHLPGVDALIKQVAPLQVNASQSAAYHFYHAHPALFSRSSPLIHVREIVVSDEKLALHLLDQVRTGISFTRLAQQYSVDPRQYRDQGGDLGWIARRQMPPVWENVAFALAPNQISNVFQLGNLYYILQMIGTPLYHLIPYTQVSPPVPTVEAQYVQQQQFLTWLSEKIVREPIDIREQAYSQAVWATMSCLQTTPDQGVSEEA
jgi:parvulin-like peptidyl-prolyl isomerase